MPTKPRAPDGLKAAGAKLWKDITGTYDLRPDELRVLAHACRTEDLCTRLQDEIDALGDLVAEGSMGQPVIAPTVAEVAKQRGLFARLMKQLDLPDGDEEAAGERSTQAREAATARWRRGA